MVERLLSSFYFLLGVPEAILCALKFIFKLFLQLLQLGQLEFLVLTTLIYLTVLNEFLEFFLNRFDLNESSLGQAINFFVHVCNLSIGGRNFLCHLIDLALLVLNTSV